MSVRATAIHFCQCCLRRAKADGGVGVLTGGRLTVEDAYAYSKFTRVVVGSNDIDFRSRPVSAEETEFLASSVVGVGDVHYADVDNATAVVIAGLEPEEECPILFLRLRKQVTARKLPVYAVAPFTSRGLEKLSATVIGTVPGHEADMLASNESVQSALATERPLLIVGERLATAHGALAAAAALAARTGAKLAWVPRRAGDRGAIEGRGKGRRQAIGQAGGEPDQGGPFAPPSRAPARRLKLQRPRCFH